MMHGLSAVKFESFFELDNNKRTRGHSTHSCKLTKKRFRTDLRQHFFTERIIINVWNSLDEQTVSLAVSTVLKAIFNDSRVT